MTQIPDDVMQEVETLKSCLVAKIDEIDADLIAQAILSERQRSHDWWIAGRDAAANAAIVGKPHAPADIRTYDVDSAYYKGRGDASLAIRALEPPAEITPTITLPEPAPPTEYLKQAYADYVEATGKEAPADLTTALTNATALLADRSSRLGTKDAEITLLRAQLAEAWGLIKQVTVGDHYREHLEYLMEADAWLEATKEVEG